MATLTAQNLYQYSLEFQKHFQICNRNMICRSADTTRILLWLAPVSSFFFIFRKLPIPKSCAHISNLSLKRKWDDIPKKKNSIVICKWWKSLSTSEKNVQKSWQEQYLLQLKSSRRSDIWSIIQTKSQNGKPWSWVVLASVRYASSWIWFWFP